MATYARGNPARWWRSGAIGRWGGAHRSPAGMFISPLRRLTSWLLLGVLLLLIVGGWWATNPQRISRMAEVLLADVLGGVVEVGGGRVSLSGTLVLSNVVVKTHNSNDPAATIFAAEELELRYDWLSLLSGRLKATQITALRPRLVLIEDRQTQRWNYQELLTRRRPTPPARSPGGEMALPAIILREARLQWGQTDKGAIEYTPESIIEGQLLPEGASTYRLRMEKRGAGSMTARRDAPTIVTGTWEVARNRFSASISDIELTADIKRSLPREVRTLWDQYQLRGRLTALQTSFDPVNGFVLHVGLSNVALTFTVDGSVLLTKKSQQVAVSNVHGQLEIQPGTGRVRLTNLRGRALGHSVVCQGEILGGGPVAPFNMTLALEKMRLDEDYPKIAYALHPSRDLIERVRPRGVVDVRVDLKRATWNGPVAVTGRILCRDLQMRFGHFPYPLHKVQGPIYFNNEYVQFDNVTAMADECPITIDGTAGITWDDPHIDFKVSSRQAVFDERMAACLPQQFARLWRQLEPWARGSFVCHVVRRGRDHYRLDTTLTVDLTEGRARYAELPCEIRNLRGRIVFTGTETRLENITGTVGGDDSGKVSLSGLVRYPEGDVENLQPVLQVKAEGVPLDREVLAALPPEWTRWRSLASVTGKLDVDAEVRRGAEGGPSATGRVQVRDGSVRAHDGAYALDNIAAALRVGPEKVVLDSLTAHVGQEGTLTLRGTYAPAARVADLELNGKWRGFKVAPRPPAFLSADLAQTWAKYKPAGMVDGDVAAQLHLDLASLMGGPATTQPAASPLESYTLHLAPRRLKLAPAQWPAPVELAGGTLTLTPERLTMQKLQARTGGAEPVALNWSGTYQLASGALELSGSAAAEKLPAAWLRYLAGNDKAAESTVKALLDYKPEGRLTVEISKLKRSAPDKPWVFVGTVGAEEMKTALGPVLVQGRGLRAQGAGTLDLAKGNVAFEGKLTSTDVTLSGKGLAPKVLEGLRAAAKLQDRVLSLSDVDATVAEGKLQGKLKLEFQPQLRYAGDLVLNDAQLAKLLLPADATPEERKKVGTGRVTATLAVQEVFRPDSTSERTGRGELVVREGKLYDVPLAMGLMQLVTLRLPVSRAFESATMGYYIRDNKVTFEKIVLESPGLNLAGTGTLGLQDRKLDLALLTESPNEWRFPLLTEIVELARRELLQVHVSGTVDAPEIKGVPLGTLAQTLRLLLPRKK